MLLSTIETKNMKNHILILSFLLLAMNPSQAQQEDVSELKTVLSVSLDY